jgi:hypothetical protein
MQTVVALPSLIAETQKIFADIKHLNQLAATIRAANNHAPVQSTFTTALMLRYRSVAPAEAERSSMKKAYAPEAKFTAVNRNDKPFQSAYPTRSERGENAEPSGAGRSESIQNVHSCELRHAPGTNASEAPRHPGGRIHDCMDAKDAFKRATDVARAEESKFSARVKRKREARRAERQSRRKEWRAKQYARSCPRVWWDGQGEEGFRNGTKPK